MNRTKSSLLRARTLWGILGGTLALLTGCASIEAGNTDVRPWNRPARPELGSSGWPWWASWWGASGYEEQEWMRARRSSSW